MKELLTKYPKAAKVVKDYYLEKFLQTLDDKNLPEDFKQHCKEQGLQEGLIEEVLEMNCRALFDVFDENEIYIKIDIKGIENPTFWWSIHALKGTLGENSFKTRNEAEKAAICKSFELLEEKL